uniref:Exportin-1/Importin-beta-like domain-containing protein n=2 Tax=Plectus sambesii TaxID=2011161 RepID=A0A914UYM9_9BILA
MREQSENAPLVEATLKTLLKFLNWIPVGYIFETNLVDHLTQKFLLVPMFRSVTLQCLMEIAGISLPDKNDTYNEKLVFMFTNTMAQMKQMMDPSLNLAEAFKVGSDDDQKFIANLAQFLCTFLKEHSGLVEVTDNKESDVKTAHELGMVYMLKISEVDDVEIFKICLDYWNWMSAELYRECPFLCSSMGSFVGAFGLGALSSNHQVPPRRRLY